MNLLERVRATPTHEWVLAGLVFAVVLALCYLTDWIDWFKGVTRDDT